MSANEAYELAVRLRGEQIDETADQVEGVGDSFADASDEVGDSAGEMESFSSKWAGAMGAIVTGLAVAAAGLATQIPVVGGLMEGLFAVIEAVAFQMDSVLRPVLQPITDGFFQLADAIFNMQGPAGALVGILASIAVVALPIAAVFGLTAGIIAAVVAGVILLLSHFGLLEPLIQLVTTAVQAGIAVFMEFASLIGGAVSSAIDFLAEKFSGLASAAFEWGRDLILRFRDGILDVATAPVDAAQDVIDGVTGAIGFDLRSNDRMAERWGEDMLTHFSVGMDRGARMLDMSINAGRNRGGSGGQPASDTVVVENNMDGKRVTSTLQPRLGTRRKSRQRDGT